MQSILLATFVGTIFAVLVTPWAIELFRARGVGQLIREELPAAHFVKADTPTMGGLVILVAATAGYTAAHIRFDGLRPGFRSFSSAGLIVLATAWALGLLGAIDDTTKIRRRRSLGLNKRAKLIGQSLIGFGLAYAALNIVGLEPAITTTGLDQQPFLVTMAPVVFAIWVLLITAGTSNGVNFTDGLDGLASGSSAMAFFVLSIIGFWEFRHDDLYPALGGRHSPYLDLAVLSAALLGACIGFLWWNAAPARIHMGDTGSLAIGGALTALALFTRTQVLLPVICGLFVMETLSVIVQVISFRLFGGRRVFAMAPLHHHFELRGWAEFTVIVRFWLIAALFAGTGLAFFYLAFLRTGTNL